jgi:hypothetical protein
MMGNNNSSNVPTLPAFSLFQVLMVSVVIAVFLTSLIGLNYYSNLIYDRNAEKIRLTRHVYDAIEFLSSTPKERLDNVTVHLGINGQDSIVLNKRYWGVYELIQTEATSRFWRDSTYFRKCALLGEVPFGVYNSTLFVQENSKPILVSGVTKIKGEVYLPKSGFKLNPIGNNLFDSQFINESIPKNTSRILPKIKKVIIEQLINSTKSQKKFSGKIESTTNSFFNPTKYFYKHYVSLDNCTLNGNIVVVADSCIDVFKGAKLNNVILIAPKISIHNGVKSNLQAFAFDTLKIEPFVDLHYPSALLVYNQDEKKTSFINIEKNTKINGVIFGITSNARTIPNQKRVWIRIINSSAIHGQVFSEGDISLEGKVLGNIVCKNFALFTEGAIYDSQIHNTNLSILDRDKAYLMPCIFEYNKNHVINKGILEWLD